MKAIYISSSTVPSRSANSMHVMKMCQAFGRLGHSIELYAPKRRYALKLPTSNDLWLHYGITDRFPIRWLASSPFLREYDYAVRAAAKARGERPDLVLARNTPAAAVAARMGLTTVCETHDLPGGIFNRLSHRLLKSTAACRALVFISEAFRPLYEAKVGRIADRLAVLTLPDAVDLRMFEDLPSPSSARSRLEIPEAPLVLGYAGNLYRGRGIELILDMADRHRQFSFLIMGGRQEATAALSERVNNRKLGNVRVRGFIPNAQLPLYLAACDVLLMPYQRSVAVSGGGDTAAWMSPLKMFEYMASGRLIVSSDLPALRAILNEANALLCAPDNPAAWYNAISRAHTDRQLRHRLGAQAQRDVRPYSWEHRVKHILESVAPERGKKS